MVNLLLNVTNTLIWILKHMNNKLNTIEIIYTFIRINYILYFVLVCNLISYPFSYYSGTNLT